MTAETLRKIVALCGPVKRANGGIIYLDQMPNENFINSADHILAHARRVLREKHGLDVRWGTYDNRWYFGRDDGEGKAHPTEAESILAALESVQPKVEPLKNQYTVTSATGGCSFKVYDNSGETISLSRLHALLNAPHYTQADIDEAVEKAVASANTDEICRAELAIKEASNLRLHVRVYPSAIASARQVARAMGWTIAVHGSEIRDLDLVAVPWSESCRSEAELVEAIRAAVDGKFRECDVPAKRPHGRTAYPIYLPGGSYMDLSVMPCKAISLQKGGAK